MTLTQQVFAQARLMAQDLPREKDALLEAVCHAAVVSLGNRLRDGLSPEDCLAEFVTAAGMYAIAAMSSVGEFGDLEQFTAGDVTLRRGDNNAASSCLRTQADMLMAPYMKPATVFMGV